MKTVERPAIVDEHVDIDGLKDQVEKKHAEVAQADTNSAALKREAGDILVRMKEKVGKGWQAWVKKNLKIHYRTVARYMRIAREWPEIEKKLAERKPDGNSDEPDLCTFSATAVLRSISKPRAKGKKRNGPKIPPRLAPFAERLQRAAREVGVRAPGGAIIGLLKRLGIPDAELVNYLEKLDAGAEKG